MVSANNKNPKMTKPYEGEIEALERDKFKFGEKLLNSPPQGKFDDFIELSLRFRASLCEILEI
jgi:hypothetical protein